MWIEGRNFLIDGPSGKSKCGFYTVRFVEAADAEAAESAAVNRLRERSSLREMVLNGPDDPPMMYVTEIEQLESFEGIESLDPGLIWYDEAENAGDDPAEAGEA